MLPAQLQVPPVNNSPGIPVNPSFVPMTSPTFQTPMSRLRYHNRKGIWNGKPGSKTVSPAWVQSMPGSILNLAVSSPAPPSRQEARAGWALDCTTKPGGKANSSLQGILGSM